MNKVVGIAGGSGAGKSALCLNLCRNHPETFCILYLDDYFKKVEDVPTMNGFKNYDHPDALRFEDFISDLTMLKNGGTIKVRSRGELYNPEYSKSIDHKIEVEISPKPVILTEGYLVLHVERIRNLMDTKIYLDLPIEESLKRRGVAGRGITGDEYFNQVLIPMHREFVEPTKLYADRVINVSSFSEYGLVSDVENGLMNNVK